MEIQSRSDKLQLTGNNLRRASRTKQAAEGEPPAVEDKVSLHSTGRSPSKARVRQSSRSTGKTPPASSREIPITILHTNDLHGHVEPYLEGNTMVGGIAQLSARVNDERAKDPDHTILLDAGDTNRGAALSDYFQGRPILDAMNKMGYLAKAMGNHDFDSQLDDLATHMSRSKSPILAANLINRSPDSPLTGKTKPYMMTEIDGVKIGIIGLITPDSIEMIHNKDDARMIGFEAPEKTLTKYLPRLQEEGAQVIILLSHLGIEKDREIADEFKDIDLIVGGHSHQNLKRAEKHGNTTIVQAGCYGKFLGKVDLSYDPLTEKVRVKKCGLIPIVSEKIEPDPAVDSIIKKYETRLGPIMGKVIGDVDGDLTQRDFHKYREESRIGDVLTDIIRDAADADIGFLTASSMRSNIYEGPLKAGDIYSVFPWPDNLTLIRLKGKDIPDLLEQSLTSVANGLAISGIRAVIDTSLPAGQQVVSVTDENGQPLKKDKYYTIATRDFLAQGSLGLEAMERARGRRDLGDIRKKIIDVIKRTGKIIARTDGRLINESQR